MAELSTLGSVIKTAYEGETNTNAFTDAEKTKLTGVEASADVTDATNVAAAGAVMDGDFSANGIMQRTGSGTYSVIKINTGATADPTANDDNTGGYAIGSQWLNITTDKEFVCLDATTAAAVWKETTAGAGSSIANVVEDTTPQLGGNLDLNGSAIAFPSVSVTDALDEDTMSSDSATKLATQQSIKAYADGVQDTAIAAHIGKKMIPILAQSLTPNTTNGAAAGSTETTTNAVMLSTLDFDASTDESAQILLPMPKSWNESTITFRTRWTAGATGNVVWGCQAVAISDDDAVDSAFGTAVTVTDGVTAADDFMISAESSAVTIGGTPAEGDLVAFKFYRDADNGSDTLASDAKLIAVDLFITTNAGTDA